MGHLDLSYLFGFHWSTQMFTTVLRVIVLESFYLEGDFRAVINNGNNRGKPRCAYGCMCLAVALVDADV